MKCVYLALATLFILASTPAAFSNPTDKAPETQDKTLPKSDTSKTDKSAKPEKIEDLDAFFEKGERQSEDGPSCRPETKPIA